MSDKLVFTTIGEKQTRELGALLSGHLGPGNLVVLQGTLGAGKSVLARSMIRTLLNQPELDVPSPTFLLVLGYGGAGIEVLHADLYRLEQSGELEELGLFDNPDAIVIVEWPQRAPELIESADLAISIEFSDTQEARTFTISSPSNAACFKTLAETGTGFE